MTIKELYQWETKNGVTSYNLVTFGIDVDSTLYIDIRDLDINNEKKEVSIE